ncbi:MAG: DUF2169 domain-containing protein, partial [Deltaproteobacteria bacterium]|nr:DUF2169 domain-containing protein [Deltaproteobacteria bacterium]
MKTLKPQKLSVLHKTFENEGSCYFTVSIFALFAFDQPDRLLPEVSLWKLALEELGDDQALDECMPKTHGEVLVYGTAHPPGDEPQPVCAARVQLGSVDKTLYVVGDRVWRRGVATDPEPFTEMEVSWRTAFGGEGYEPNPAGKGMGPITNDEGQEDHPLPNVEDPRKLVKSPKDRPAPTSFGAYPLTAPQRQKKAGTYDNHWLKNRFPGYAEDFDWTFFNVGGDDQQLEDFFQGGEPFRIENMHPAEQVIEGQLPTFQARCFVTRHGGEGELEAVPTRIDTVILLPNRRRGILVFRGVAEVTEDDAADLEHLLVAAEQPGAPRPLDHYRAVLEKRLDKEMGAVHSLRDDDLLPPGPTGPAPPDDTISDVEGLIAGDGILKQRLRRRAERELDKVREEVAAMGLDPDELDLPAELPAEPKPPTLDEAPDFVGEQLRLADQLKKDVEAKQAEAEAEIRQLCEDSGVDYDVVMAEAKRASGGPPDFSAAAELERLRDMARLGDNAGVPIPWVAERLADPKLEQ